MKKLFIAAVLAAASFSASAMTVRDCEYLGNFATAATLDRENGFSAEETINQVVRHRYKMSDPIFTASMLMIRSIHDSPAFQKETPFSLGRIYYDACMDRLEQEASK